MDRRHSEGRSCELLIREIDETFADGWFIQILELFLLRPSRHSNAGRGAQFVKIRQPVLTQDLEYAETPLAAEDLLTQGRASAGASRATMKTQVPCPGFYFGLGQDA